MIMEKFKQELNVAEEFITMMIESDIFKNNDEKIHYLLNKDFSNNEYVKNLIINEKTIKFFRKMAVSYKGDMF